MAEFKIRLKVKQVAEERGWNAARLGRRADLSNTAIYGIWNEETDNPGLKTLAAIARVLGVKTSDLYEVEGEGESGKMDANRRRLVPSTLATG